LRGAWVDTNNSGFDISDNYISNNYAGAIQYEISYNALISDNTLVDNGAAIGATCDNWRFGFHLGRSAACQGAPPARRVGSFGGFWLVVAGGRARQGEPVIRASVVQAM
jgi:hypothetical protein